MDKHVPKAMSLSYLSLLFFFFVLMSNVLCFFQICIICVLTTMGSSIIINGSIHLLGVISYSDITMMFFGNLSVFPDWLYIEHKRHAEKNDN